MKIVIIGAGAVGFDVARAISQREHDVVVVEKDLATLQAAQEQLDCRFVHGSGTNPDLLESIGMADTTYFTAVSDSDEVNIIACLTASRLGAWRTGARVRSSDYYHGRRPLLRGIYRAINPEHEAAHAIREILFQTAAREIHEFASGTVRIIGSVVEEKSYVAGKSLAELNSQLGAGIALVAAIRRGEETLIPDGHTVVQAGDMVYFSGARRQVDRSLFFVQAHTSELNKVMIVGADARGRELARDLLGARVKVKLVDPDAERCRIASEELHHALVLHGEPVDGELLESEGVGEMDAFVAVSDDEEVNILSCLLARHHGVRKTACLVNRPDYVPLLPKLGIDAAVSPRLSTATSIARLIQKGETIETETLGFSGAEILEVKLTAKCRVVGKPLKRAAFPRGAVVGAVIKRGRVETPRGDTILEEDDRILVFSLPSALAEVEKLLGGGTGAT